MFSIFGKLSLPQTHRLFDWLQDVPILADLLRSDNFSLSEVPERCSTFAKCADAQSILAEIEELEVQAPLLLEAEVLVKKANAERIKELRGLVIQTPDGPKAVDHLYRRLSDFSFLCQTSFQWRIGLVPDFCVSLTHNANCTLDLGLRGPKLKVTGAQSYPSPLLAASLKGKSLAHPLNLRALPLLVVCLAAGILAGVGLALLHFKHVLPDSFSAIVSAPSLGLAAEPNLATLIVLGAACGAALGALFQALVNACMPASQLHLAMHFTGTLPDAMREKILTLQTQFEKVLVISRIHGWSKGDQPSQVLPSQPALSEFLLIVGNGDNYWLPDVEPEPTGESDDEQSTAFRLTTAEQFPATEAHVQLSGRVSLSEIPDLYSAFAVPPDPSIISPEHVRELELRRDLMLGMEADEKARLQREIVRLNWLITVGPFDNAYPRLNLGFLNQLMLTEELPDFAVFRTDRPFSSASVNPGKGLQRTTWSYGDLASPLVFTSNQRFYRRLLKGLSIAGAIGALVGGVAPMMSDSVYALLDSIHAPWLGVIVGMVGAIACYVSIAPNLMSIAESCSCQLNQRIPDDIRELIRFLGEKFDEVFLITEARNWSKFVGAWPPVSKLDRNFLVVARKVQTHWLAASIFSPREKDKPAFDDLPIDELQ